jgi:hypothetical protein
MLSEKKRGPRTIEEVNVIRAEAGLPLRKSEAKPRKNNSILPASKKARHQEILAAMLNKKSKAIVQKVMDKALLDGDPDQMACLKIVMDRILPPEYFTKAKANGNKIEINITGVGTQISNTIDADFEEVEDGQG